MNSVTDYLATLEAQRQALKMPLQVVAARAKLSRATVYRILKEKSASASMEKVIAIAKVLGAAFNVELQEPDKLIEQQVMKRARRIVQMVQGTMALEAQGMTEQRDLDQLVETAAKVIRAKPRKQLWMNQRPRSSRSQAKRPSPTSPS